MLAGAVQLLGEAESLAEGLFEWTFQEGDPRQKRLRPPPPRFVSQTPSTVTLDPLPFRPTSGAVIVSYAVFGKPTGTGVSVSLNNTECPGMGVKVRAGEPLTVTGLSPNLSYSFAVAGYDIHGIEIGGIGETTQALVTMHPLPLTAIWGTLCFAANTLKEWGITRQAADILHWRFVQRAPVGQPELQEALAKKDKSISTRLWLVGLDHNTNEDRIADCLHRYGLTRKENWSMAGPASLDHNGPDICYDRLLHFSKQQKVLLSFANLQHSKKAKLWFEQNPRLVFGGTLGGYEGGQPLLLRSPMGLEAIDMKMIARSPTTLVRSFVKTEFVLVEMSIRNIYRKRKEVADEFADPPLSKQISLLEGCQRLTMALDASMAIDDEKLVVECIARIMVLLQPLLAMSQPSSFMLRVLVACDSAMKVTMLLSNYIVPPIRIRLLLINLHSNHIVTPAGRVESDRQAPSPTDLLCRRSCPQHLHIDARPGYSLCGSSFGPPRAGDGEGGRVSKGASGCQGGALAYGGEKDGAAWTGAWFDLTFTM